MANVAQMRPTVQPSRTPLGDFSRNRWAWLDGVEEDTELPPSAKVLASVLARRVADHVSGDCFPGNALLMRLMGGKSEDTVQRAFKALAARGWLRRSEGRGRGNKAAVTFLMPGKVVSLTAHMEAKATATPPKSDQKTPQTCGQEKAADMRFQETEKAADMRAKGRTNAASRIEPKSNQKGREAAQSRQPCPVNILAVVSPDDSEGRIEDWNAWLTKRGYPTLQELRCCDDQGRYGLPSARPPHTADETDRDHQRAHRWATWAVDRMGANHDH